LASTKLTSVSSAMGAWSTLIPQPFTRHFKEEIGCSLLLGVDSNAVRRRVLIPFGEPE
jgi:hypothetical protein